MYISREDQIELLKLHLEDWNKYRKDNPEFIPSLENAELYDTNLKGANLIGADLEVANLEDTCIK